MNLSTPPIHDLCFRKTFLDIATNVEVGKPPIILSAPKLVKLRSLERLSHASQGHHLDDLVLGYPVLASFPAEATVLHPAKSNDS